MNVGPNAPSRPVAIDCGELGEHSLDDRYTPEQMVAGAIVIGVLILALFGLILWQELAADCWEKDSGSDPQCVALKSTVPPGWSPTATGAVTGSGTLGQPQEVRARELPGS